MKGRKQEAHIIAQEEGLGLNSFFEFQAIEMLDYLRMKSEKKLPAKDAMTPVQIDSSYRIHKSSHVRWYSCDAPLTNISWEGRKGGRAGATGKAGGEGGGSYFIERRFHRNRSEWKTKQIKQTNRCWASWRASEPVGWAA